MLPHSNLSSFAFVCFHSLSVACGKTSRKKKKKRKSKCGLPAAIVEAWLSRTMGQNGTDSLLCMNLGRNKLLVAPYSVAVRAPYQPKSLHPGSFCI